MGRRKKPPQQSQKPLEWQSLEKLPTERQDKTFQNFIASGCDIRKLEQCAIDAGYPKKYARMLGIQALKAHAHNPIVIKALAKHNITIDRTIEKISKIMDAKHPNPKFTDDDGKRADDNPTQLRATQTAISLIDIMPSKKLDISADIKEHKEIFISVETVERIKRADAIIEGEIVHE